MTKTLKCQNKDFPRTQRVGISVSKQEMGMDLQTLREYFKHMVTAREMDLLEQSYTGRGEAFFHVSGAGHEGTCF